MDTTLKTRYGVLQFHVRDGGGYVHVWRRSQQLTAQICEGGGWHGQTIEVAADADLDRVVRKWWRATCRVYGGAEGAWRARP
jgi:hypothetical protein